MTTTCADPAPELGYHVHEGVALLTIQCPERLNAWTPGLEQALHARLNEARHDDAVRCIVLTGAGRAFCAGMDMAVLAQTASTPATEPADHAETPTDSASTAAEPALRYGYLDAIDKPMIAAINGAAAGVGLCLALYCDLRFVATGARLTLPYARRGLVAEHGIAWLLPRLIGPMRAADLLLSGRTFDAEEADRIGLATMLPQDGFLDAVMARAHAQANLSSPRSVRIIKQQLRRARTQTLAQATVLADQEIAACRETADFAEGVQHFLEKRAPRFTGR